MCLGISLYDRLYWTPTVVQTACKRQRGRCFWLASQCPGYGIRKFHPGNSPTMNLQCTLKFLKHSLPTWLLEFMVHSRFNTCYRVFISRLYANCYVSSRPKFATPRRRKFRPRTDIAIGVLPARRQQVLPQNSWKISSFMVRIWCRYEATTSNLTSLPFTYRNDEH